MAENQIEEPTRELSYGERAVGLPFNPSNDDTVTKIKQEAARLIDLFYDLREETDDPEIKRMASLAITDAQTAQMWGVKAATWKLSNA